MMTAGPLHATLVANTITPLTIDVAALRGDIASFASTPRSMVRVTNVTGTAAVYFTTNGADPTVGGAGCYVLPATICSLSLPLPQGSSAPVVKLISSGTPTVSVWDAT